MKHKRDSSSDSVRLSRLRQTEREIEATGTTGRVVEDRRAPHGVRVELRVPVDEIREPHLRIKERLPGPWLSELLSDPAEHPWTAHEDAAVDVTLARDAQAVRVRGTGSFRLQHVCVRCLEDIPFDLDLDLDLRLVARESARDLASGSTLEYGLNEALDGDAEQIDLGEQDDIPFDGRVVDVGALFREQLFLEVPPHPTCESEGAHPPGPCVVDREGALAEEQSRWVDPRWQGLLALKDRLGS